MSEGEQKQLAEFLELSRKVDRLSREHREIKKTLEKKLEKSQRDVAFYQSQFQPARQIMEAVKKGRVKTPQFKPDFLENEKYLTAIRLIIKQIVYGLWNREKRPTKNRKEIVPLVKEKVKELIRLGKWNAKRWRPPGTDTIVRRLNECASSAYWQGNPPLICIKGGAYMPNPIFFDEEAQKEMWKLIEKWRMRRT